MKLFATIGLAFGLLASSVTANYRFRIQDDYQIAGYCTDHLYYCGKVLLDTGKYLPEIKLALSEAGIKNPDQNTIRESLFYCREDAENGVGFERTCKQCHNGGVGKSDFCDDVGP